jgi:hypothetical protein
LLSSWPFLTCPLDAVVSAVVAVAPPLSDRSLVVMPLSDPSLVVMPLSDPSLVVMPLKSRHSDCTKMNEEMERSQ